MESSEAMLGKNNHLAQPVESVRFVRLLAILVLGVNVFGLSFISLGPILALRHLLDSVWLSLAWGVSVLFFLISIYNAINVLAFRISRHGIKLGLAKNINWSEISRAVMFKRQLVTFEHRESRIERLSVLIGLLSSGNEIIKTLRAISPIYIERPSGGDLAFVRTLVMRRYFGVFAIFWFNTTWAFAYSEAISLTIRKSAIDPRWYADVTDKRLFSVLILMASGATWLYITRHSWIVQLGFLYNSLITILILSDEGLESVRATLLQISRNGIYIGLGLGFWALLSAILIDVTRRANESP